MDECYAVVLCAVLDMDAEGWKRWLSKRDGSREYEIK